MTKHTTELETRLTALIEECRRHETALSYDFTHKTLRGLALEAARIGAEIEREACAALLMSEANRLHESGTPDFTAGVVESARTIRARGCK
jgi:hypothetical protein